MSKIALVTDSTCSMPKELMEKYNISVAPQVLIWGKETFEDGVNITPSEFYTRIKKATVMPSTTQVTVASFLEIYQKLLDQDYPNPIYPDLFQAVRNGQLGRAGKSDAAR